MKEQNNIEELFKDRFKDFEADPGANAWSAVQGGLQAGGAISGGTAGGGAAGGFSSWMASAIVGVLITATAISGYFFFDQKGEEQKQQNQEVVQDEQSNDLLPPSEEITSDEAITPAVPEQPELKEKVLAKENKSASLDSNKIDGKDKGKSRSALEESDPATTTDASNNRADVENSIDDILKAAEASKNDNTAVSESKNAANTVKENNNQASNTVNTVDKNAATKSQTNPVTTDAPEEQAKTDEPQVEFPNVFTPDLDGTNDVFTYTAEHSDEIDNINISIYAANSNLVKEINGLNKGWDGKLPDGTMAPAGPYAYRAIIFKDGKTYIKKGKFNIRY